TFPLCLSASTAAVRRNSPATTMTITASSASPRSPVGCAARTGLERSPPTPTTRDYAMSEKAKHTPGPAWGSAYYEGAAGAAAREALAVTEAARNLQTRAEQLDMAAQEIAVLEAINADLLAALEGLMEWEDEIAAN